MLSPPPPAPRASPPPASSPPRTRRLKPPTAFFSPFMLLKTLQYAVLLPFLRRLPLVGRLFPGAAPAVPAEPASS